MGNGIIDLLIHVLSSYFVFLRQVRGAYDKFPDIFRTGI